MTTVGTSYFFDRSRDRMEALNATADRLQTQISTGKKLTEPGQDPAGWQRLQTLIQAKADGNSYSGNIDTAQAILAQLDNSLGSVSSSLQRALELAIRSNSSTTSGQDRAAIATELDSIVGELNQLAETKDARGKALFDAAVGAIPIADGVSVQTNESRSRVFGTIVPQLQAFVAQLRSGGDISNGAATAITQINTALTETANVRSVAGVRAQRVQLVAAAAEDASTQVEAQRQSIEDTDLTSAITDLQRTMTVLQATQASFGKLTQLSLFDYLR